MAWRLGRISTAAIIGFVVAVTSACSDEPADDAVADVGPVAFSLRVELDSPAGSAETATTGWWDPVLRRGALVDDTGEIASHEREGVVLRAEINPNVSTDWTAYDLAAWGSATTADNGYWGEAIFVGLTAAPSIESVFALRATAAELIEMNDGPATVMVPGNQFLDSLDELLARHALHPCELEVPVDVEVIDGRITQMSYGIDLATMTRTIDAAFTGPTTETTAWPNDSTILETTVPSITAPRPRPAAACDWAPREPVTMDRAGCVSAPVRDRSLDGFELMTAYGERVPGAPGQAWIVPLEPFDIATVIDDAAERGLSVLGLMAETPLNDGTVASQAGDDVLPTSQEELNATAMIGPPHEAVGDTLVVGIAVDGAWGDIAEWAGDCSIYNVAHALLGQTPETPDHFGS